jgi:hypothetical protein
MRKVLIGLLAAGAVAMATPASAARVWVDVVAPPVFVAPPPPVYVAPAAYAYEPCRVIRERIVRPNGTIVWRQRRVC